MINFFWQNISKFIKEKLTKSEYNYKLIDLKKVILAGRIELENNKLDPLTKGLLLDERKGKFEEIDLNSDSNYNKLETKHLKPLKSIDNLSINYTSWYDYLKKKIFGNRYQEKLNYFFKFFQRRININEEHNHIFSFNCDGNFLGFINKNGNLIISEINSNNSADIMDITINSFVNSFSFIAFT